MRPFREKKIGGTGTGEVRGSGFVRSSRSPSGRTRERENGVRGAECGSIRQVGERLVGFRHLVHVVALLDRLALATVGVKITGASGHRESSNRQVFQFNVLPE